MIKKLFLFISLKRYGVQITSKPNEKGHFSIQDLINDSDKLHEILVSHQKEGVNNPNLTIIGTMFGKRYSVLPMSVLDTMILSGKLFDASPENIYVKLTESGAFYFYVHPKNIFPLQSLTLDEKQHLVQNFNNNHLKTLFEAVAKISNSKEQHLLSLVSHNLHQRSLFLQRRFPKKKGNIEQILNLFIKDHNSEQNNPLNFTFNKFENAEGSVQYIRKYCCLEYLQHNHNLDKCCSTCPHLYK